MLPLANGSASSPFPVAYCLSLHNFSGHSQVPRHLRRCQLIWFIVLGSWSVSVHDWIWYSIRYSLYVDQTYSSELGVQIHSVFFVNVQFRVVLPSCMLFRFSFYYLDHVQHVSKETLSTTFKSLFFISWAETESLLLFTLLPSTLSAQILLSWLKLLLINEDTFWYTPSLDSIIQILNHYNNTLGTVFNFSTSTYVILGFLIISLGVNKLV